MKMSGPYSWECPSYWMDPKALSNTQGGAYGFFTGTPPPLSLPLLFDPYPSSLFPFPSLFVYSIWLEGGPGQNPLPWEVFEATVSEKYWWPMNQMWDFHCGNQIGVFRNLDRFTLPLYGRYAYLLLFLFLFFVLFLFSSFCFISFHLVIECNTDMEMLLREKTIFSAHRYSIHLIPEFIQLLIFKRYI